MTGPATAAPAVKAEPMKADTASSTGDSGKGKVAMSKTPRHHRAKAVTNTATKSTVKSDATAK